MPVDMLVLGFHFLQNFDYFEIMRGLAETGDYHLKAEFSRAAIEANDFVLPKRLVAPCDIIDYVKNNNMNKQLIISSDINTFNLFKNIQKEYV